ncbi:NACHT domain-containing protein [Sorangium sp. So ce341]|uniref:NACHT domain-containing protein n=1 Tax=Sorangium sp. So ce341 TaxID=3133302 RepID=UPI003F61D1E7
MAERGGPTTQSGILFQNSIAALFLARLVDPRRRGAAERVIHVRVESPDHVDDVVTKHADGHTEWLQAKEVIDIGGAWNKLWQDFKLQASRASFGRADRLVLATSFYTDLIRDIDELSRRAGTSRTLGELTSRLTSALRATLKRICATHDPPLSREDAFQLLQRVDVEVFGSIKQIERDHVPVWVPESSVSADTLFRLLRDRVGGEARVRGDFVASDLLESLARQSGVRIADQQDSVSRYQDGLAARCSRLEVPGTNLAGPMEELFVWPRLAEERRGTEPSPLVNAEDASGAHAGTEISLDGFPGLALSRAVLVAGAGFGKSSMLCAVALRLLKGRTWVPAIISLPELAESREGIAEFLARKSKSDFNCEVSWPLYIESCRAVLLFDGLDEVRARRAEVLEKIIALSGMFPRLPWLMAVREAAAVSMPIGVPFVRLLPMDYDAVDRFVNAYAKYGARVSSGVVVERMFIDREFKQLASVPFFLALILATSTADDIGRGRTDLLERYLSIALHPERHRTHARLENDYDVLRSAAEILAEEALSLSGPGLDERRALAILRQHVPDSRPVSLLNDLTTCGIFRTWSMWTSFSFPIVQEYLAACRLVARGEDAVVRSFELLRLRPWAQTIQFAIEMMPDATGTVRKLLSLRDDAYCSISRMVARCIAHGARVEPRLRAEVGDALADFWVSAPTLDLKEQAADSLAHGWASSLPPLARAVVTSSSPYFIGVGRVVSAANDPALTLAVLANVLHRFLEDTHHLQDLQEPVNGVASEALNAYLARVETASDVEIESLAYLVQHLARERLDEAAVRKGRRDSKLPLLIRLALAQLDPAASEGERLCLAEEVLTRPCRATNQLPDGALLALDSLSCSQPSLEMLARVLPTATDELAWLMLFRLVSPKAPQDAKIAALRDLAATPRLPATIRRAIELLLLHVGDVTCFASLMRALPELSPSELQFFITVVSQREPELMRALLTALEGLDSEAKGALASSLAWGIQYDVEILGFESSSGRARGSVHPLRRDCADALFLWSHAAAQPARLKLLASSTQLEHPDAGGLLREELLLLFQDREMELGEHDLSTYLRALSDRALLLPVDVLVSFLEGAESNPAAAAAEMIARWGTRDALDALLGLCSRHPIGAFERDAIERHVELLASRLGITLDRDESGTLTIRSASLGSSM